MRISTGGVISVFQSFIIVLGQAHLFPNLTFTCNICRLKCCSIFVNSEAAVEFPSGGTCTPGSLWCEEGIKTDLASLRCGDPVSPQFTEKTETNFTISFSFSPYAHRFTIKTCQDCNLGYIKLINLGKLFFL